MEMEKKFEELKARLQEFYDLEMVGSLLNWDQSTYMPPGGAPARARQMATIGKLAQEKFIDPEVGRLLDDLRPYEEQHPYDSYEASVIRVTRREYERAVKIPAAFMGKMYAHIAESYQAWAKARPENNFKAVAPYLERTLDYSRELANFFPGYDHIADPLIDFADYGMKASSVRELFANLRTELVPLVKAITEQPPLDDRSLHQHFEKEKQLKFSEDVIRQLGYDFERGRQDLTHHPFTTKFSLGDVRITTRVDEQFIGDCLFSSIHEAGHAMYEQGISKDYEGTPLASGTSAGIHESQSRLWENVVGRSLGFWEYFFPHIQATFPDQLSQTTLDEFYRAVNKVEPSLIRTEADEVTYNLHILLRFDFELDLLEGKLPIRDLPETWRERYQNDLGISSADDRNGVMQDVHWFGGIIGGSFQGYTLGNIMGALFYEKALQSVPEIPEQIRKGDFSPLHSWLKENIYKYGSVYTADELIQRVTGGPVQIEPYIRYLRNKYSGIYPL